ncbi:MAG TPA: carboxylesterase family protein [Chitinophagales bacterium]|nr:carboxylesterase family protein [Chitinophagales bacterium]
MKYIFTLIIALVYLTNYAQCDPERYRNEIFPNVITHADIIYGNNKDNKGQSTDLLMTVYEPDEVITELRPLIIFIHGGSFTGGDRTDQHLDFTSERFARKGYVSANIEYRLEQTVFISPYVNFADKNNWYKAMIRSIQDIRASIRYFKKDVAENGNIYNIDTSKIILYGISAGAIAGLHVAYLDNLEEASAPFKKNFIELGGLEGNSGSAGYTSNGIKAVVNASGAIDNMNYLNNNLDIPLISFHHKIDLTVPFDKGCFITVACFLGDFYGSNKISQQAKKIGLPYEFYPINKEGHPADDFNDTAVHEMVVAKTTEFLYKHVICTDAMTPIAKRETKTFNIFPNPSSGWITIENETNLLHQTCTLQIIDQYGQIIQEQEFIADTQNQFSFNIASGLYTLRVLSNKDLSEQYVSRLAIVH